MSVTKGPAIPADLFEKLSALPDNPRKRNAKKYAMIDEVLRKFPDKNITDIARLCGVDRCLVIRRRECLSSKNI